MEERVWRQQKLRVRFHRFDELWWGGCYEKDLIVVVQREGLVEVDSELGEGMVVMNESIYRR